MRQSKGQCDPRDPVGRKMLMNFIVCGTLGVVLGVLLGVVLDLIGYVSNALLSFGERRLLKWQTP